MNIDFREPKLAINVTTLYNFANWAFSLSLIFYSKIRLFELR